MIERFINLRNKKYFHVIITIVIMTIILFTLGVLILRYHVEGETNMPFCVSKISIISSAEGYDKEAINTKWAFDISQSNDIFLYLDKNEQYDAQEIIKSVTVDNFQIDAKQKENIKIYRPDATEEKMIFKNKQENIVQKIEYLAEGQSNLKQLKISNQGGIIAFRCSYDNLAEYTSNEEEIKHQELLAKAGVKLEDLKMKVTFDLIIELEKGKKYLSTINLDFPVEDIIEKGTTSREITDLKDIIFKRVNN